LLKIKGGRRFEICGRLGLSERVNIAPAEIAKMLRSPKPPRLLDVRQPEEHELVALPDSKLIPLGQLFHRIEELESWKDEEIVVYCHHGIRSQQAISLLRQAGFKNLINLQGGIDAWSVEVDPVLRRY
jgi:rhodanese-related sulfurtransferase